jgi:hypothetical protein
VLTLPGKYSYSRDTFYGHKIDKLEIHAIQRRRERHFELLNDWSKDEFGFPHGKALTDAVPLASRKRQVSKRLKLAVSLIKRTEPPLGFETFRLGPVVWVSMQQIYWYN